MPPGSADPSAEAELLRRRLARERRARITAEQVGERATAQLYETVQELRIAQRELQQHAEDQRLLNDLFRELHRDLDTDRVLRRAVMLIGEAAGADRCLVRLAESNRIGPIVQQWTRPGVPPLDPDLDPPGPLEELCRAAARRRQSLLVDDIGDDARLAAAEATLVVDALGIQGYLGTPMWVGDQLIGWLALHEATHGRPWTARQLAITTGVARDLGTALMQAQAFQQQEEAVRHLEQANRVKNELVSTVSHELRTPLTSIAGYLELLRNDELGTLSDRQHQALTVLARNTERLMSTIEDLLSLSSADSGAAHRPLARIDPAQLVSAAYQALLPIATERGVTLRTVTDDRLPPLIGDALGLERMLLNLLSNALKFTPDGGSVSVSATTEGDAVVLTVSDTGHGIDADDLPRIFDRFYRTADASQRAIQGTGLGLAVVKAIVDQHRGTIDLTSSLGHGTTVEVRLPAASAGSPGAGPTDGVDARRDPVSRSSTAPTAGR